MQIRNSEVRIENGNSEWRIAYNAPYAMKLRELAGLLGCRLEGDGEIEIVRVAAIHDAGPGDVTFLANPKYADALASTRADAVIARPDVPAAKPAMLRTDDPYLAFARAVGLFAPAWRPARGVHPMTAIASDAQIGQDVSIGPFVAIGEAVRIGDRTVIFPNVTIGPGTTIGADCVIHSNVAIRERVAIGSRVILQNGVAVGGDGYGFVRRPDGTHEKIPQVAAVVIEDDVELGANTTVDRPAVGETRIKAGAKIDNLVQIGHNVRVGRRCLLVAQVGIAGSTELGESVQVGGQSGFAGHLKIGDRARIYSKSAVFEDVPPGVWVRGIPAVSQREYVRQQRERRK